MIASVSTLARSIGATRPSSLLDGRQALRATATFWMACATPPSISCRGPARCCNRQKQRQHGDQSREFAHRVVLRRSARFAHVGENGRRSRQPQPSPGSPDGSTTGALAASKLRLEVDAQRSPGSRRSAFMARHIEQPACAIRNRRRRRPCRARLRLTL